MLLTLYCRCGAIAEGEIEPAAARRTEQAWHEIHTDPECEPCTRAESMLRDGARLLAEVVR